MPDIAIVGAGAAGLSAAIFARRFNPSASVVLLDSARVPGAKILVSGGARCNVTNRVVSEADFRGGPRTIVRRVLRAFPVPHTVQFFAAMGVDLHDEADGKLFPDSNRARDVRDALLREAARLGVQLRAGVRVHDVEHRGTGFRLATSADSIDAAAVVLATGGQSLPKTGSDGAGFEMARRLGHRIVPTTPALVPLVLEDAPAALHRELTGVAHDSALQLRVDGRVAERLGGALLWTHFGISGPLALNMSRHYLRARLDRRDVTLTVGFCPGHTFETLDDKWQCLAAERPKASVHTALATLVPAAVASSLLTRLPIAADVALAHFARDDRRRLVAALLDWPLAVVGSRGYNYAEVTAGGVSLDEIDPGTMASRRCDGLYLVGEILDIDGRIGGFNFQWAWSSAFVAARALAARST